MSEIRSQATPARDELAEDIFRSAANIDQGLYEHEAQKLANRLLAAGWSKPRTVNSATELDGLAEGSVILVDAGRYGLSAWQKHANGRWCEASHCEESMTSTELRVGNLPATVLFTPGDAG
ncbi:hypothetical protein RCF19_30030 [Rhodococcus qingshengii]